MGIPTQTPSIMINGKKINMPKPKIKLWRHLIKFTERQQNGELEGENVFNEMMDLVVVAFNHPDVNRETVEDNIDFEDLTAIFNHIAYYATTVATNKLAQVPNGETPARV